MRCPWMTKTYELFQRGDTVGIFNTNPRDAEVHEGAEADYLRDLIAMNALYRPVPEYIPEFIDRKHGMQTGDV